MKIIQHSEHKYFFSKNMWVLNQNYVKQKMFVTIKLP